MGVWAPERPGGAPFAALGTHGYRSGYPSVPALGGATRERVGCGDQDEPAAIASGLRHKPAAEPDLGRGPAPVGWTSDGAVRGLAIATVLLLALLLAIQTVSESDTFGVRAIGVVAVLYVLATVLIPLLRLVERPDG